MVMGVDSNPSQPSVSDSNTGVGDMPWNNAEVGSATAYNTIAAVQGTNPYNNLMDSQVDGQAEAVIEIKTDGSTTLLQNPNVEDEEEIDQDSSGRKLRRGRKGKTRGPASQAGSTRPTGPPSAGDKGGGTTVTIGTGGQTGGTGGFSGLIGGGLQNPITSATTTYTSFSGQNSLRKTVSASSSIGADMAQSKVGGQKDEKRKQELDQEKRYGGYEGQPAGTPGTDTWNHTLGHDAYFEYAWKDLEKAQYYAFNKIDAGGASYVNWAIQYEGPNKPEGYEPMKFIESRQGVPTEKGHEAEDTQVNYLPNAGVALAMGLTGAIAVLTISLLRDRQQIN